MANNYKLISLCADSADVVKKIADTLAKIPATGSGPVILAISTFEREVKPVDKSKKAYTTHVCQVLGTPFAVNQATMLANFADAACVAIDAPDDSYRTSVVLTDASQKHLVFTDEQVPAETK